LGRISRLFWEFGVGSLVSFSIIHQTKSASPLEIFSIVFNLCFTGKNLFEGVIRKKAIKLNKRHVYGFLNNPFYNWRKLFFLFSARIYLVFRNLNTNPDEEVLIVDDFTYDRGWSDGNSFLGLDFALLSFFKISKLLLAGT
jgi:hypothetical protein